MCNTLTARKWRSAGSWLYRRQNRKLSDSAFEAERWRYLKIAVRWPLIEWIVGHPYRGRGTGVFGKLSPVGASSSSDPDGHIDDLAAQVGNVLADVSGTELVWRTVEILRQLHADVVRAWLRAPVA